MHDFERTFFELGEAAKEAGLGIDAYIKTDDGARLAQQYCEQIASSVGAAWPAAEQGRRFGEFLDSGIAIVEVAEDDGEEPFEILSAKAKELLAAGSAKNFGEAIELACARLPDVADAHNRRMRGNSPG